MDVVASPAQLGDHAQQAILAFGRLEATDDSSDDSSLGNPKASPKPSALGRFQVGRRIDGRINDECRAHRPQTSLRVSRGH